MDNSVSLRLRAVKIKKKEWQWVFGLTMVSLEHCYGKLNELIFFIPYSTVNLLNKSFPQSSMVFLLGNMLTIYQKKTTVAEN